MFLVKQCSEEVSIWSDVKKCVDSESGRKLLLRAETETHVFGDPWPKNIPTCVFNSQFDQEKQNRALTEFKKITCEHIAETVKPVPAVCA